MQLQNGTQSAQLAEEALFTRHPVMKKWPKGALKKMYMWLFIIKNTLISDHNFFFATLKMEQIILMDYFGGPKYVDVKEYLRATPST